MESLSSEILRTILGYLPNQDIKSALLTSRQLSVLSQLDKEKRQHYKSLEFFALSYHQFDFIRPIPQEIIKERQPCDICKYKDPCQICKSYDNRTILEKFSDCLLRAVTSGHLLFLQWIYAELQQQPFNFAFDRQCVNNISDYYRNKFYSPEIFDRAAINGHLPLLSWLITIRPSDYNQPICSNLALNYASANGHLPVVQWMTENKIGQCTEIAMNEAIHYRHDQVVQYLHQNRKEGPSLDALTYCINRTSVPNPRTEAEAMSQIKWLLTHYPDRFPLNIEHDTDRFFAAAENGDYELAKFLFYNRGAKGFARMIDKLCCHGNLDIIKFVHFNLQHSELATENAIDNAVYGEYFDVVKFLYFARNEGFTHSSLEFAATKGNLEMLKWLIERYKNKIYYNQLKSDANTSGHSHIIKYIKSKTY